jgi:adenosylcobinamide-GDP ribazoletransferase
LLSSLVLAVALTIALGGSVAVATMGMGILLLVLIRQRCLTLLGGVTGDVLGATNEVIEILFLLLIPALGMAR